MDMSGLVRSSSPLTFLLVIMFIFLSVKLNRRLLAHMLLVVVRMMLLPTIRYLISPPLLLCSILIFLLAMPKKYTEQLLTFRVIDSHWKCIDPYAFSGTLADFLAFLGIDYLPDSLEFARLRIKDDFSIWIYNGAMCVKFKLINKPSNFLQMNKMPKIDINSIPSQLNTEKPSGVASQLANVAAAPPHFDGVIIN